MTSGAGAALGPRLRVAEVMGWLPWAQVWRDALAAIRGSPTAPRTLVGLSTLSIAKPWISLPTWLGIRRRDRRVPIYNFFNRVPAPDDAPYSARVTFARDWRGGRYTYDSHLGTDFATPVGTPVTAAAPGRVVRVANDYDRGGLKVCIDHGDGLVTTSNHLARALVRTGERVARGQVVGLSGASGIEFLLGFPWVAPHLHFNTWLDGDPVDPFAPEGSGEAPLWRAGNHPQPHTGGAEDSSAPTAWDPDGVRAGIAACRDEGLRARMEAIEDPQARAVELLVQRNYRRASFASFPPLVRDRHPRAGRLDLPFLARDYVGIAYPGYPD